VTVRPVDGTEQPGVLLAASLWWPLSARLATRFVESGCRVSALCPTGHILRHVSGLHSIHTYRPFHSLGSLEAAIDAVRPAYVVPCDDRVVAQLHELHERRPDLRALIESSLGPAAEYGIIDCRERLLETARQLDIRVPETRRIESAHDVRAWFGEDLSAAVLKRDGTWGGDGVEIVRCEEDALAALRRLDRRPRAGLALKRLLVNRDPLAVWAWRRRERPAISIQKFIAGRPANAMLACWRGELLGLVTAEVLSSQGATGAGIVVRLIDNAEITRAARLLTDRLGLTGFYGLDFMLDAATGFPYLIEMNPRCTQLGHLSLREQGDLAGMFCARLHGRSLPEPGFPIERDVVAFFPQALFSHPPGAITHAAHLDVPWNHPPLVRELLLPSWPERHWIARLYHFFHAPRKVSTTEFEAVAVSTPLALSAREGRRDRLRR
jgi:hypothetical protein